MQGNTIHSEIILQELQLIRQTIQKVQTQNLSKLIKRLNQLQLAYAIFLISNHDFSGLISLKSQDVQVLCAKIDKFAPFVYQIPQYKHEKNFLLRLKEIRGSKKYKQTYESMTYQKIHNQQQFCEFLSSLVETIKTQKSQTLKKTIQLGFKIKNYEADNKNSNFNAFEQYAANFLNYCLQSVRVKLQQPPQYLCCKTIFFKGQQIKASEGKSQQFKRYIWPIVNQSIRNHITKTIIGFMNSNGGVIYIGITQNKDKKNQVCGIQLKQTEVQPLKQLIMQLINFILPKHLGFQSIQKQKFSQKSAKSSFEFNDFVQMQFMRVVQQIKTNPKTFMNVQFRNDKKQLGSNLYIVKIIVKKGHPKHLYHVVNTQKNIDFFERPDRNVDKKAFPDAYKQIYKRLDEFEIVKQKYRNDKNKTKPERATFHPYCRYSMALQHFLLKQDLDQQSDDDDDDDD